MFVYEIKSDELNFLVSGKVSKGLLEQKIWKDVQSNWVVVEFMVAFNSQSAVDCVQRKWSN